MSRIGLLNHATAALALALAACSNETDDNGSAPDGGTQEQSPPSEGGGAAADRATAGRETVGGAPAVGGRGGVAGSAGADAEQDAGASESSAAVVAKARKGLFDWSSLPLLQHRNYIQSSTREPDGVMFPTFDPGNKDFNNFQAVCGNRPAVVFQTDAHGPCDPGVTGYVLAADDDGPGFVSRIWFAAGGNGFGSERLRVFADDFAAPVYDAPLSTWGDNASDPFVEPLVLRTSNAIVSYVPIAYQKKLRVVIDGLTESGFYYNQTNLQRGQDLGRGIATSTGAELAKVEDDVHNAAGAETLVDKMFDVPPSEKAVLLARDGSGTISQLRLALAARTPEELRSMVLRMQWERSDAPAIEMPLSAFFGAELAVSEYNTLPLAAVRAGDRIVLEANWPMPYFKHATITLENTGSVARNVVVRVSQFAAPADPAFGHFHATYEHSVGPFQDGAMHRVAKLRGRGKYVGTMVFMQGVLDSEAVAAHYALGFLEGDEEIVVDGHANILGTGTEDFFDAGYYWGSGRFDSPFATLISRAEDANGGSVTAARWHALTNSIEFAESFDFSFEYGAPRPKSATDYASVAYYYLFD